MNYSFAAAILAFITLGVICFFAKMIDENFKLAHYKEMYNNDRFDELEHRLDMQENAK